MEIHKKGSEVTTETVVVGGSSGIGLQLVRNCADCGHNVTVISRTWMHGDEIPNVRHVNIDITVDEIQTEELPSEINGLAYCPGSINLKSIRALGLDTLRNDFELNVVGMVKTVQSCLKNLKAGSSNGPSSIVLFSTVAVGQGLQMHASVAACKGAIEALTRTMAADLSPQIRVNCIAPALTNTPLASNFFTNQEKAAAMAKMYPLGRTGEASDIADLASFLISEKSSWITGQVIGVDGGMSSIRK